MTLVHLIDLEPGITSFGKINDTMDQVNTNTTNIATNTSDIALKQNANAASTLNDVYDSTHNGNYVLLGTDVNKIFDITNSGASTFTLPPTGTIAAFRVGCKIIIINNQSSLGVISLTPGAGVTITTGNLTTDFSAGTTATVIRTGTNTYKRIY